MNTEVVALMKELQTVQEEMNCRSAAVREINLRINAATDKRIKMTAEDTVQVLEDLKAHSAAFKKAARKGVEVYHRLKAAGYGTPQLDEWEESVRDTKLA